jgi:hypothetical protein
MWSGDVHAGLRLRSAADLTMDRLSEHTYLASSSINRISVSRSSPHYARRMGVFLRETPLTIPPRTRPRRA